MPLRTDKERREMRRLIAHFQSKGLSIRAVAKCVGLDESTVRREYLRGSSPAPVRGSYPRTVESAPAGEDPRIEGNIVPLTRRAAG